MEFPTEIRDEASPCQFGKSLYEIMSPLRRMGSHPRGLTPPLPGGWEISAGSLKILQSGAGPASYRPTAIRGLKSRLFL